MKTYNRQMKKIIAHIRYLIIWLFKKNVTSRIYFHFRHFNRL